MELLKSALASILDDESTISYITEVAEASENVEEFSQVCVPIFLEAESVVSSEEDAVELSSTLFNLKIPPPPAQLSIQTPIIISSKLGNIEVDPFEQERLISAKQYIQDVGHVRGLKQDVDARSYQKHLKKKEQQINQMREKRRQKAEEENTQFKKDMGFRRPKNRAPSELKLENINIAIGGSTILQNSSINISPGNRYGLIGRNGIGKTTFMRYLNSSLLKGATDFLIVHVQQEVPVSDETVFQVVLDIDLDRLDLLKELETNPSKELSEKIEQIDGFGAEVRVRNILRALGFSDSMMEKKVSECSGGFRMRISLAQALFIQPDILLLDEPTGHLDAPSVCWLEEYLQYFKGMLICVSHDRVFLDNVATHIVHLKDKQLCLYSGNFSSFQRQYQEKMNFIQNQLMVQQKEIDKKREYINKMGAKAAFASLAKSKEKQIEKIEKQMVQPVTHDPNVTFNFNLKSVASVDNLITMDGFSFGYTDLLFKNSSFGIMKKTKACVIGPNGAGKSTLMNLILGKLRPSFGNYQIAPNLRIAHFSQHHVDQLDFNLNPIQYLLNIFRKDYSLSEIRAQLGKFGISKDLAFQPIQYLSGGEKTKVVLVECALLHPHILLLDEVTNNLDMDSIDALGHALNAFQGAIVAITHDQHFIELFASEIYIVANQNVERFYGNFNDYRIMTKDSIRNQFFKNTSKTIG